MPTSVPLPIETECLLIRPFLAAGDAERMAAVYCDPEVMRYVPGGALRDPAAVRATLETHAATGERLGFGVWAVVERRTGDVIGDAGFGILEPTGDVELGYTLARAYWGRGYATEAAAACLDAGLAHIAAPRIVAVVDVDNAASLRVAEKIGMTRVGEIELHGRPHALFAAQR